MRNVIEKSLVIYRNRPALVSGLEGEKINISVYSLISAGQKSDETAKVREKDIETIHPGPCAASDLGIKLPQANVREAWELLAGDETTLKGLAELVYGQYSPRTALAAWELLVDGLYFSGSINSIKVRSASEVEEEEKKRAEKQKKTGDRAVFLEKLKKLPPFRGVPPAAPELSEVDRPFLQEVEALARGQSDKSRTLKELNKSETPEEAHRLLLAAGVWTLWENPHPNRFGLTRTSSKIIPAPPPDEERLDLSAMASYAIDNPWSDDPDDAVSLEILRDGSLCLWVHVADPASSVGPESPADLEARSRGSTLYLPEGPSRMLSEEALSLFALGAVSPALSFKLSLNGNYGIEAVEIYRSRVKVTRLTYGEADTLIAEGGKDGEILLSLAALAEHNAERRLNCGAVMIDFPETRVHVDLSGGNRVSVEPVPQYRSAALVRECMILAGEGAARWALQRQLPFPFISQESGELPERLPEGLAGAWQLRRCMRPRTISLKPSPHFGLGLDEYTQVTSPLRRYTDLLCHQQIRSFLGGQKPIGEDEILFRASAAEAAASVVSRAEKASRAHWLAVYLLEKMNSFGADNEESAFEALVLDRKGSRGTLIIPALGIETQVSLKGNEELNDKVLLKLSSVKIPEGEAVFVLSG